MTSYNPPPSVIEVEPSFFFLAFLLYFFKPKVAIDGSPPADVPWGVTPIPVAPGRHHVEIWVPYLFTPNMGRNGVAVDVPAGAVVRVKWKAPWLVFLTGAIEASAPRALPNGGGLSSTGTAAALTSPAGWHPDPSGRHEHRYFDGTQWTEHVATGGVPSTDPGEARP